MNSVVDESSSDDNSDYDDDAFKFMVLGFTLKEQRKSYWVHTRVDWEKHVTKLLHENRFHKRYRMSLKDFNFLVRLLQKYIKPNWDMSSRRCDHPIIAEVVVAVGLRYLSGGTYDDIMNVYGMSKTGLYKSRNKFLDAVLQCPELAIKLPSTPEQWERIRIGFARKSTNGIMRGCVGAIDGFLQPVTTPRLKECNNNPRAYFSGHYNTTGLNCQGLCDSHLRFLHFSVIAPGKTADCRAYEDTGLPNIVNNLPSGIYIVGDAAYMLTEHMLVPFTGAEKLDIEKDAYNFFQSQIRIRIEMAFGRLTTKWRILRRKLETSLKVSSKILSACAILHNFVINRQLGKEEFVRHVTKDCNLEIIAMQDSPLGWGYLPTVEELVPIPGTSQTRDIVLRKVTREGLRRPTHNVERRRLDLHDIGLM